MDQALHRWREGPRWLENPRVAQMLVDVILAGDHEQDWYELSAWIVMSNHVHLILLPKAPLEGIARRLKEASAEGANRLLGRGRMPFWAEDGDEQRTIDAEELDRILGHVEENPVALGMMATLGPWLWRGEARCAPGCEDRNYCILAHSDSACVRTGMPGSASFQRERKSRYAALALAVSPDKANARANCKRATAPTGSATTMPR